MALDIYAGSMTRYYCNDWENIVEQQAKRDGFKYTQMSPHGVVDKRNRPKDEEVQQ